MVNDDNNLSKKFKDLTYNEKQKAVKQYQELIKARNKILQDQKKDIQDENIIDGEFEVIDEGR